VPAPARSELLSQKHEAKGVMGMSMWQMQQVFPAAVIRKGG
jgi:hypothetical protein